MLYPAAPWFAAVLGSLLLGGCNLGAAAGPAPGDAGVTDAPDGKTDRPPPDAARDAGARLMWPVDEVDGFRVASWNLEAFPLAPSTIDRVVPLVEAERFDLIGVQEITDPEPFEALADALEGYAHVVSFDRGFIRVGFLYRPDRVEVTDIDRLFTADNWAFPRAPLKANIRVFDETGETVFDFIFVVVHLKAQIDAESRSRRALAMERLEAWMSEQLATGDEQDIVVVGDFNDALTDAPAENVFAPVLDRPEQYRFLSMEAEHRGEYSYIPFRVMIDHVLVTTDALDEYGAGATYAWAIDEEDNAYRREISDHRPVIADFRLAP
jgi:exonuclease III